MTIHLELFECLLRSESVEKAYDVLVVDEFHELEFAVSALRVGHILEGARQFFDGAILTSHSVVSRTHDSLEPTEVQHLLNKSVYTIP